MLYHILVCYHMLACYSMLCLIILMMMAWALGIPIGASLSLSESIMRDLLCYMNYHDIRGTTACEEASARRHTEGSNPLFGSTWGRLSQYWYWLPRCLCEFVVALGSSQLVALACDRMRGRILLWYHQTQEETGNQIAGMNWGEVNPNFEFLSYQ